MDDIVIVAMLTSLDDAMLDLFLSGISFTPREIGEHLVNVYRNGTHIPNSPFKIYVGESEIGNASKVKVTGRGIVEGMANEVNEFTINTKEAGMIKFWNVLI